MYQICSIFVIPITIGLILCFPEDLALSTVSRSLFGLAFIFHYSCQRFYYKQTFPKERAFKCAVNHI